MSDILNEWNSSMMKNSFKFLKHKKEKDAVCGKPRSGQRSTDWPLFFWRREDVFAQNLFFQKVYNRNLNLRLG